MDHHSPPPLSRSPVSSLTTDFYPSPDLGASHCQLDFMYGQLCDMESGHTTPPPDALMGAAPAAGLPPAAYDFALCGPAEYAPDLPFATPPAACRRTRTAGYEVAYARAGTPGRSVKAENPVNFYASQYPSPELARAIPEGYGAAAGAPGAYADSTTQAWPRAQYSPLDEETYASLEGSHETNVVSLPPPPRAPSRLARKPPRRLTTKEDANYQCRVEGCGKLFSRSYNYKAHLETHDDQREYPFPCAVSGCGRRFVRKTDLSRHHQSVHAKERNHECDYCGRLFARKDTLRRCVLLFPFPMPPFLVPPSRWLTPASALRHMEDGCSRRFDIGVVDVPGGGSYSTPREGELGLHSPLPPMDYPRSPATSREPVSSLVLRGV